MRFYRLFGLRKTYWFTRSNIIVPLSSLTLFLSELTSEPCAAFAAGASFILDIPIMPSVFAVICGRAFALLLLPVSEAVGIVFAVGVFAGSRASASHA